MEAVAGAGGTDRSELARLVREVRWRGRHLDEAATAGLRYRAATAAVLVRVAGRVGAAHVWLAGRIDGPLDLTEPCRHGLTVSATLDSTLRLGTVDGDLVVRPADGSSRMAEIDLRAADGRATTADPDHGATPRAEIELRGRIDGDVDVDLRGRGGLTLAGSVTGTMRVRGADRRRPDRPGPEPRAGVAGAARREVWLLRDAEVGGDLVVDGLVRRLRVLGRVEGCLVVTGRSERSISLEGEVGTHLLIRPEAVLDQNLWVNGRVGGELLVEGRVERALGIDGSVGGNVWVNGEVGGSVTVNGPVEGDLRVAGRVGGSVNVWHDRGDDRHPPLGPLFNQGRVHGNVWVDGSVGRDVWIVGRLERNLWLDGTIDGDVVVDGLLTQGDLHLGAGAVVSGGIRLAPESEVGGGVWLAGTVAEDVRTAGIIRGILHLNARISGQVSITGWAKDVWLRGMIHGGGRLALDRSWEETANHTGTHRPAGSAVDDDPISISRLSCRLRAPLFLGDGFTMTRCDLRHFDDYDQLRFLGADLFDRRDGRQYIEPPRPVEGAPTHQERATTYRRLRSVFEAQQNRPGAGDFYFQELSARRLAAGERWRADPRRDLASLGEYLILTAYRLLSSYGLRAWQPTAWFATVAVTTGLLFRSGGLDLDPGRFVDEATLADSWMFAVQSMVGFFAPPGAELGLGGRVLQLGCRFVGPILLAQAVLAVRERIAR